MSTLAEIEAAIPSLSAAELDSLARKVEEARAKRVGRSGSDDLANWLRRRKPMLPDDADAFAKDVEAAREMMNRPVRLPEWD
jgi:hypothetical protein